MRVIFSVVSLLVVVLVVGFLAKSQLTGATRAPAGLSGAGAAALPQEVASAANALQSRNQKPADTVRAVEQSVNATLDQATKRLEAETK